MIFSAMISVFFVVLTTAFSGASAGNSATVCRDYTKTDVYALFDTSGSISRESLELMRNYACDVFAEFTLGVSGVQVALGVFSSTYRHVANLNAYTNINDLCKAIFNIPYLQQNTYTDVAFDGVRTGGYLTDLKLGARPNVPKVLFLMTDGQSQTPTKTVAAAAKFVASGTIVIVIGVGQFSYPELRSCVSKEENVLTVSGFDTLDLVKQKLIRVICAESILKSYTCSLPKGDFTLTPPADQDTTEAPAPPPPSTTTTTTTPPPTTTTTTTTTTPPPTTTTTTTTTTKPPTTTTTTTTTPKPTTTTTTTTTKPPTTTPSTPEPTAAPCPLTPVDVAFCIDSSGSIGSDDFDQNKVFTRIVCQAFNISIQFANICVFTFGTHPRSVISPLSSDPAVVYSSIPKAEYQASSTQTHLCIKAAQADLLNGRSGVKKVLVIITDGASSTPDLSISAANDAKSAGILIIAVGVTASIDAKELSTLSTTGSFEKVSDYDHLKQYAANVAYDICQYGRS